MYCVLESCFFFNDTATTEIYTLSLHDALPIFRPGDRHGPRRHLPARGARRRVRQGRPHPARRDPRPRGRRSEEHTSELQSRQYLVCRLLLEKKKKQIITQKLGLPNTTRPQSST